MGSEQFPITDLAMMTTASVKEAALGMNTSLQDGGSIEPIEMHPVLISTVWGMITFIGTVGNLVVIFTMCKHAGRSMPRSATDCYIMNVAIADLAFNLMVVPISTAAYVSENWMYGEVMCKLTNYIIYVTLVSTCLTLTAMTIDRYFAIVHPLRSLQRRTPKSTIILCVIIWIASFAVCSPFLMVHEVQQIMMYTMVTVCLEQWPPGWKKVVTIIVVMVTYVIPLTVIIVSYTLILKVLWRHKTGGLHRGLNQNSESSTAVMGGGGTVACKRKKVAKIVATVVLLFASTWLPIHLINLCFTLVENIPKTQTMYNIKIFAHTLSYTNSCVNPFVYTIMGDNFRKAFKESICRRRSSSSSARTGYSRRTGSVMETRFNGE